MHHTVRLATAAAFVLAGTFGAVAQNTAQKSQDGANAVLKGKAALGGWQQDKPGLRELLDEVEE